jgi:amino acid transporter
MASGLRRSLTLLDGAAIIVGTTIGSGIFATPGRVLNQVGSVGAALAVWVVGGLLSIAGALCYAELGAALPVSGGEYAYLSRIFGKPLGFMFTWTNFAVLKTGSQAIISIVFARYFGSVLFNLDLRTKNLDADPRLKALAVGALLLLTTVNCVGVRWGAAVQVIFTALKLLALGGVIVVGVADLFQGGLSHFSLPVTNAANLAPTGLNFLSAFGAAMITCLFAYDGWNNLNYVTEELQDPERNLPRAIILGSLGVMAVYVLVNIAYLAVLTPQEMVASKAVARDLALRTIGPIGGILIPLAVAASTFGSTNGSLITGARVFYAAARDGQFPSIFAKLGKTATPVAALVIQGVWAAVLVTKGNFDALVDYFGFAAWLFYGLAAIGLIVLRSQAPDLPRPYKVWGYPVIPIAFIAIAAFLVGNSIYTAPIPSLGAVGFMALGFFVYYAFFDKQSVVK